MQKSSLIILVLLIFFICFGFFLVTAPEKTNRIQRAVAQTLGVKQNLSPCKPLSHKQLFFSRMVGLLYLGLGLLLLGNMDFQFGRFSLEKEPVFTSGVSSGIIPSKRTLHDRVCDFIQPETERYPGMVIGTIADGIQGLTGFGRINVTSDLPPDGKTLFEIGSISKVFTGILLADQIIKQKLTLETPLVSLVPSIPGTNRAFTDQITMAHLVTHTAGLKRMPGSLFFPSQIWQVFTAQNSYANYRPETLLKAAAKRKFRHRPGAKYAYSNLGFGLLGMAMANLNNTSYSTLIDTVIAAPLGLTDTQLFPTPAQKERMAKGVRLYLCLGDFFMAQRAEEWNFPDCIAGAGGLRSTGNDMLRFLSANMELHGTPLSSALTFAHTPLFSDKTLKVGMGWHHTPLTPSDTQIVWHNGTTGGFSSFLGFTSDRRFGVVILSNSARKVDKLAIKILNVLVKNDTPL